MSNESDLEKTKAMQIYFGKLLYENGIMKNKLRAIREALWHHCLENESENQLMMRAYPNGPKTVPAFLVNAQLIDDIYQMTHVDNDRVVSKQYPKPLD